MKIFFQRFALALLAQMNIHDRPDKVELLSKLMFKAWLMMMLSESESGRELTEVNPSTTNERTKIQWPI